MFILFEFNSIHSYWPIFMILTRLCVQEEYFKKNKR